MLVDRYPPEDVFGRVPELADQTDPVLVQLDHLLDDDILYQQVRADFARRYRRTPVHGRHSTPAEVLLRLLVVQHLYAWSYAETVERVADSLVLRWFCRVYFQHVPDKTTLLRWAQTLRPETLQALVDRAAQLAQQAKVTRARKLRIDSTCVQTPIHHPTDSGVLGDGVRVLTRLILRAKPLVHPALAGVRDAFRSRVRSARHVLQQLHRVRHSGKRDAATTAQRRLYTRLLEITRQTVRQAHRVRAALEASQPPAPGGVAQMHPPVRERVVGRLLAQFDQFLPLVQQSMHQAWARVLEGQPVPSTAKVLSLFEPHTRVVIRRKLGAAVEFGRQVMRDEVEGGIVTRVQVLADQESECHQALPAVQHHQALFGRPPWLVVGDRRLHARGVVETAQGLGVTQVVIPRTGPASAAQRARERERSWRRRYRWRAGIAGRIHSLRRDYGLARCRSHGLVGLERDVGWGVLASDLRHIAVAQARREAPVSGRAA
ncbi:MAG TPA: ISNCY family transposase [Ktedonobacterales bacterium]|nr:ISNCY family transposase [Ktedonobacterales bacterium]